MEWLRVESTCLWALFVVSFLAVAIWESLGSLRNTSEPSEKRWSRHGIVLIAGIVTTAFLIRATPVAVALWVGDSPYGILNHPAIPCWLQFSAGLVFLDLTHYGAHRLVHSVPLLWRFHEVHHSDPDYDVSTAGRFHPIDGIFRHTIYLAAVVILAPPAAAVLVSELLVAGGNFFVHANCALPPRWERAVRRMLITPDLHRLHHSENPSEYNLNFGQSFSWWDQLLKTYQEKGEGAQIETGIRGVAGERALSIKYLLLSPFLKRGS